MHPLLKSKGSVFAYLAVWVFLGLLFLMALGGTGLLHRGEALAITIPVILMLSVECLGPWFYLRALPLRSTPVAKLLAIWLLSAIVMSAMILALVHGLIVLLRGTDPGLYRRLHPALPVLAGMTILIYLLSIAMHYVLFAMESSRKAELLSREAELKALKAQVNPHFLFNSLNSISALTSTDPAKAREMCIRLSEFLRSSLRLGERLSIPFAEELALSKTYLDVEQVRFGSRLRVKQDLDPECATCEVPPLLVQPLIENSIKHGIATLVEGGEVAITGRRGADSIRITIENPYDPDAPETRRNGFGLASVRNRLSARYGSAAKLDIQVGDDIYRVMLTIPCEPEGGTR